MFVLKNGRVREGNRDETKMKYNSLQLLHNVLGNKVSQR